LNREQLEKIIKHGKPIDGHTWHYDFLVLACSKYAKVAQQQREYSIEINAGSYFTVIGQDSSMRFGNYNKKDEQYFLAPPAPRNNKKF
jgi:transposase